jgi:hypothetical protein
MVEDASGTRFPESQGNQEPTPHVEPSSKPQILGTANPGRGRTGGLRKATTPGHTPER